MNMMKVTDLLNEAGVSHRHLSPSAIRIDSIIDGASRPVLVFDARTNQSTEMPDYPRLSEKRKGYLKVLVKRMCITNTH